jgi:hypothetical protein
LGNRLFWEIDYFGKYLVYIARGSLAENQQTTTHGFHCPPRLLGAHAPSALLSAPSALLDGFEAKKGWGDQGTAIE